MTVWICLLTVDAGLVGWAVADNEGYKAEPLVVLLLLEDLLLNLLASSRDNRIALAISSSPLLVAGCVLAACPYTVLNTKPYSLAMKNTCGTKLIPSLRRLS